MIKFIADTHSYLNIDDAEMLQWISVTRLIHYFKEPFDAPGMAVKCSKGKNPKYKGKTPEQILAMWDAENKRATTLGSWYHDRREQELLEFKTITRDGIELPIVAPIYDKQVKLAPSQRLEPGIYPEHLVYLKSVGICGQSDRIEVCDKKLHVYDYKTNKEIKREGYKFWDGTTKKMRGPLSHLDDCEFNDYALQLSTYMYMILKHNYHLKPGKIEISHVKFKVKELDANGYPVTELDMYNNPIIDTIEYIELPYLKDEVMSMFKYVNNNRDKILSHGH